MSSDAWWIAWRGRVETAWGELLVGMTLRPGDPLRREIDAMRRVMRETPPLDPAVAPPTISIWRPLVASLGAAAAFVVAVIGARWC